MAIHWCESFEWIPTGSTSFSTYTQGEWDAVDTGAVNEMTVQAATDNGPDNTAGAKSIKPAANVHLCRLRKVLPSALHGTSLTVGMWLYPPAAPGGYMLMSFQDLSGNSLGTLCYDGGQTVFYSRANDAQVEISRSTTPLLASVWNYVEVAIVFNNTTGSVTYKVNGASAGSDTGLDTINAGTQVQRIQLGGTGGFSSAPRHAFNGEMTQLIFADAAIGERVVHADRATADGATTDFTPLSETFNKDEIDTDPPNDSKWNASSTVGHRDLFDFPTLSNITDVDFVQLSVRAVKETAGADNVKVVQKDGANERLSSTFGVALSEAYYTHGESVAPDGGAWTLAEVNSTEYGYEVAT